MFSARTVPEDVMLDVNEAARVAGRSPETVRRWVWSGKLAAQRQGRRLMISRDDLAALIGGNSAEAGLTLAEWAAAVRQALVASGGAARGSAADLVLADRRHRSEELAWP